MPESETMQTQDRVAPAGSAPIFADLLCAIRGKEGGYAAVEQAAALAGAQGRLTLLAVTSYRSGGAHRGPAIGPARAAEILGRAEPAGGSKKPGRLIAPGPIERMLAHGEELDMGEAEVAHIGRQLLG